MKKLLSLLLALVMVFGLIACGNTNAPETEPATAPAVETTEATQTEVVGVPFTVIVTDVDGTETTFEYTSDKATVGEALIDEGLIEGHETEYGLYVDSVNGIALDWDKDGKYWAFYIDGEYAMTGVDATEITEGATYAFKPE